MIEKVNPKHPDKIVGVTNVTYVEVPQDTYLAKNQCGKLRCGDNSTINIDITQG